MTHEPSERSYGISAGRRRGEGWWGNTWLPATHGASGRSVTGTTFWGLVKFFVVPTRYYVWKYKRESGRS